VRVGGYEYVTPAQERVLVEIDEVGPSFAGGPTATSGTAERPTSLLPRSPELNDIERVWRAASTRTPRSASRPTSMPSAKPWTGP
jgi:hypothetical protein